MDPTKNTYILLFLTPQNNLYSYDISKDTDTSRRPGQRRSREISEACEAYQEQGLAGEQDIHRPAVLPRFSSRHSRLFLTPESLPPHLRRAGVSMSAPNMKGAELRRFLSSDQRSFLTHPRGGKRSSSPAGIQNYSCSLRSNTYWRTGWITETPSRALLLINH